MFSFLGHYCYVSSFKNSKIDSPSNPQIANQTHALAISLTYGSSSKLSPDELLHKKCTHPFKKSKVDVPYKKKSIVNPYTTTKSGAIISNSIVYLNLHKPGTQFPIRQDANEVPSSEVPSDFPTIPTIVLWAMS